MDEEQFIQMRDGLRASVKRYPNCYIANCNCNEKEGEWKKGCHCMGHFTMMNKIFGGRKWDLNDFNEMAHKGLSIEEYENRIKK